MLKTETMRMFSAADEMVKGMINASGVNILDAVADMDKGTAAMFIPMCKLYANSKTYALKMADMMDEMKEQMNLLVEQNKELIQWAKCLQNEQNELIKTINKEEE